MKLSSWLDEERGRAAALAAHFNVTLGAISQWRTNGVPRQRMRAVREFTGDKVTLDEMLPDSFEPQRQAA